MCGDLEEDDSLDEALLAWLLADAKAHGAEPGASYEQPTGEPGSNAWMSHHFRAALAQALSGIVAAPEGKRADALGSHAIVLARLAGFLAGHLPPETDIFRSLVDALMDGHREPERRARARHEHSHDHGHDHSHAGGHHGHGHEH